MATVKQQKQALSFEASLTRLDEIIALLEKDNIELDELMKLYEEGVGLVRSCNGQLDSAEQKVKLLKMSPDGSSMLLQDFYEATEGEGGSAPARSRRTAKKSAEETEA